VVNPHKEQVESDFTGDVAAARVISKRIYLVHIIPEKPVKKHDFCYISPANMMKQETAIHKQKPCIAA
jgi:hypothetical protein